ncbi:MAG: hypothetical protein SFV17_17100 [Candidatus Obscuribacter sp.]|nr:hypothetical protein [Candidatus Obscuribacter sp.]
MHGHQVMPVAVPMVVVVSVVVSVVMSFSVRMFMIMHMFMFMTMNMLSVAMFVTVGYALLLLRLSIDLGGQRQTTAAFSTHSLFLRRTIRTHIIYLQYDDIATKQIH